MRMKPNIGSTVDYSFLFHLQTQRLKKGLGKDMKEKELR